MKEEESQSLWGDYSDYEVYDYYAEDGENYDDNFDDFFTKDNDEGQGDGDEEEEEDPVENLPRGIYCDLVNTLNEKCLENSILEMWQFKESRIRKLTQQDIINAVNRFGESPVYGYAINYADMLGAITRNETGHVVAARSAVHAWHTALDESKELTEEGGVGVELDLADEDTLAWEKAVIEAMFEVSKDAEKESDVKVLVNVARRSN